LEFILRAKPDTENILEKTLTALQTTLALDPNNQLARDLLLEISYQIPKPCKRMERTLYYWD
jgi:hypothetical protein